MRRIALAFVMMSITSGVFAQAVIPPAAEPGRIREPLKPKPLPESIQPQAPIVLPEIGGAPLPPKQQRQKSSSKQSSSKAALSIALKTSAR